MAGYSVRVIPKDMPRDGQMAAHQTCSALSGWCLGYPLPHPSRPLCKVHFRIWWALQQALEWSPGSSCLPDTIDAEVA